jgi:hypothetical protein
MTIRLKGGPELLRLLDELPKNLERNVIRGGLRAGAKVIQQQAKANVPVRTGKLKKAIGIGTRTEGSKLSSYVKLRGSGSYLGLFVEYGVAPHLISVADADKPVRQTRHGPRAVSIGTMNKMLKRGSLKIGAGRQRVAASAGAAMIAKFIVQRDVHRTGTVARQIVGPTVGPVESPAHVKNRGLITVGHHPHQFFGADQHLAARTHILPKSICAAGLAIAVTIPVPNGPESSKSVAVP